jgi:ribosome biogenesis protein NSA1
MRVTSPNNEGEPLLASLPTRLHDWRLSSNEETFAYGGEEVDLSVWNTEMAFLPRSETEGIVSRKRKRNDMLMPGEVWRAKNVPWFSIFISFVECLIPKDRSKTTPLVSVNPYV